MQVVMASANAVASVLLQQVAPQDSCRTPSKRSLSQTLALLLVMYPVCIVSTLGAPRRWRWWLPKHRHACMECMEDLRGGLQLRHVATGAILQRLEAERGKLERERRLHEERMRELTAEAGKLRAGTQAVAADCRAVHAALVPALRENGVLRAQLDAERLIVSSLTRGCAAALLQGHATGRGRCVVCLLAVRATCWWHWVSPGASEA